ncbi:hypothetical protein LCGC14_1286320 [marine sediment metagenome]|uniref:Uncharacterized protein n=1 Tax=marine sediment metagenome TaxID=412755 RepID=A0A0F9NAC1_9ZZZZ
MNKTDSEIKDFYDIDFDWPCPECKTQLKDAPGGGVKCPNLKCGYWFCY